MDNNIINDQEVVTVVHLICDDCGKQDETVKYRQWGTGKQCYKCYKDELYFDDEYR